MKPKKQTPQQDMEDTLDRFKIRTGTHQKKRDVQALLVGLAIAEYFSSKGVSEAFEEFNEKNLSEEDAEKIYKAKEEVDGMLRDHIYDLLNDLGRNRQEALDFVMPARGALAAIGAWDFCIDFYKDKFKNS